MSVSKPASGSCLLEQGREKVKGFDYNQKTKSGEPKKEFAKREWIGLSEAEKLIYVCGHEIGALFEASLKDDDQPTYETHSEFYRAWRDSSESAQSFKMMGALKSMGVAGYDAPSDDSSYYKERGKESDAYKSYAKKAYAFQQAFFKHLGIKEVTLYRGVKGQGLVNEPPNDGDEVQVKTREISSFSQDPNTADRFGRVIKYKIPVENVFGSNLLNPGIGTEVNEPPSWGEAEMVIMGASELTGLLAYRKTPPSKTAAKKKPFVVHLDKDNEDWLRILHKSKKKEKSKTKEKKASAESVRSRYLSNYLKDHL